MKPLPEDTLDQIIETAIRCEPMAELPVDFSQLFLEKTTIPIKPKFSIFSWVDLIASLIVALTIGVAFLLPVLIPKEFSPVFQWTLQWGGYLLMKTAFFLPGLILKIAAFLLSIGLVVACYQVVQAILRHGQHRKKILNLL